MEEESMAYTWAMMIISQDTLEASDQLANPLQVQVQTHSATRTAVMCSVGFDKFIRVAVPENRFQNRSRGWFPKYV